MPTVRLLKTVIGGYEVFNLDSALLATWLKREDLTAQIDGVATAFNTGAAYVPGTLDVFLGGKLQNFYEEITTGNPYLAESNPATGEFTLTPAPTAEMGPLYVRYIRA